MIYDKKGKNMELQLQNFDLKQISESGQCFRMWETEPGHFKMMAQDRFLEAWQEPGSETVRFDCSREVFDGFWHRYFDLDRDYCACFDLIPPGDSYLMEAAACGCGIRILRQDPWEMLITFLLSQRKSIPAIKTTIEEICKACGREVLSSRGERFYAFPDAEELRQLSLEDLKACGLGYRAKYIYAAARENPDMEAMAALEDDELSARLKGFFGVGDKVSACVMLYGYHRLRSFPRDVWMNRIIDEQYGGQIDLLPYRDIAGIMQQYLFYYVRLK